MACLAAGRPAPNVLPAGWQPPNAVRKRARTGGHEQMILEEKAAEDDDEVFVFCFAVFLSSRAIN